MSADFRTTSLYSICVLVDALLLNIDYPNYFRVCLLNIYDNINGKLTVANTNTDCIEVL